ncbi:helix-turn-helix transcriptional regulator [Pectobacterium zantedeschiae]|uniref:helix-turn-helix transcriptional regulator n=1 Tax=Pectobacterium zantedeschiae TaxID=2034769 RepID=UPI0032EADD11
MKTFAERLTAAMAASGYSQERLAAAVGLTQPAIQKMVSGKTLRSSKSVEMAQVLRVRPEWLVSGTGDMRSELIATHDPKSDLPPEDQWDTVDAWSDDTPLPKDEVAVPFLKDIELAAGNGGFIEEDYNGYKLRFSKATLRRIGANTDGEGVLCFPARGNSMEPVIPDGATVAIDTNNKQIIDGEIYAINQEGLKRIKQLYRRPGGKVMIRSFNREEYEDEIADEESVEVLGYVFWYSVIRYRR